MADGIDLDELLTALTSAVVDAERLLWTQQIRDFRSYFDKEFEPIFFDVQVTPPEDPQATDKMKEQGKAGGERESLMRVPLITLVQHSHLRIKAMELTFETELGAVEEKQSTLEYLGEDEEAPLEAFGTAAESEDKKKERREAAKVHGVSRQRTRKVMKVSMPHKPVASAPSDKGGGDEDAITPGMARITLHVEGQEPAEGLARVIDRLVKTI